MLYPLLVPPKSLQNTQSAHKKSIYSCLARRNQNIPKTFTPQKNIWMQFKKAYAAAILTLPTKNRAHNKHNQTHHRREKSYPKVRSEYQAVQIINNRPEIFKKMDRSMKHHSISKTNSTSSANNNYL